MSDNNLHVIFGSGPVGKAVMQELLSRGKRVRVVNRSGKLPEPAEVEVVAGDATDPLRTRELCAGASVVYNCSNAPYTAWPQKFPPLQAGILAGARAVNAKLIAMDNVYMYGPTGGKPLTEQLPYAATTRKGRTRAKMVYTLLEAHRRGEVRVAIGRASDFFGPGVLDSAVGERFFVPPLTGKPIEVLGNPDLPHTYTYMPDIGKGLVILGERDEALGRAWHLPVQQTITTRAFADKVFQATGYPPRLQKLSSLAVKTLGLFNPLIREVAEMLYEFEEPFIVDDTDFVNTFGNHATDLNEAITQTVAWFRSRQHDVQK